MARSLAIRVFVCWLLLTNSASAACLTTDRSAWTKAQRERYFMVAYRLVFEAGENIVPTQSGDELCFAGSTVDLVTVLAPVTLLAQIDAAILADQQATAAEQALQAAYDAEVATNDLCTATLAELDSRIDAAIDATPNTVNGMKTLLRAALKKVARCLRARAR